MGSETSKLEAPDEFGQTGNQFQIISPVSDLSCPSDIHRIHRIRSEEQQRKAHPSDPNRRISRTVTMTLQNQPKHRPSARQTEGDGVPPPSHFYFPTKETERAVERAERRSLQSDKENEGPKILKKTKKILQKTQKAMAGCFAEDQNERMEAEQRWEESKHYPTLGIARRVVPKMNRHVSIYDAGPAFKQMDDPSVTPVDVRQQSKAQGLNQSGRPLLQSSAKSSSFNVAQAALHQADDYFSRLTGGSAEESPYVENKAFQNVPNVLGKDDPDSPVSILFNEDRPSSTRSVLSKTVDSIIGSSLAKSDVKRNRHSLTSSQESVGYLSPSSSVYEYQKAIGTVAETPGYYPDDGEDDGSDDPVFSDDAGEDVKHRHVESPKEGIVTKVSTELTTIAEKADDETSSGMSDMQSKEKNTNSAFRPRNSLQKKSAHETITALASYESSNRKISKLESLFRPVLPSLSAEDAHTFGSYDLLELKVTESAPGFIETADYRKNGSPEEAAHLTALEKHLLGPFSPSMMSMDSQRGASPRITHPAVSQQALYNAEFLFKPKDKKNLKLGKSSEMDSEQFSINTSGARSRISNHTGSKGVTITQNKALLTDDQSQYSRESDRRVRFSLLDAVSSSVGLAPKESIDVPTIESKMSDLTDAVGRRSSASSRRSSDSTTKPVESVKDSLETVPLTAQDEEADEPGPAGQWSYKNDGVTPYRKGMNVKDATNSPYIRFQSAKTRFESQAAVVEVPEIQNKVSDLTDDTGDVKGRTSVGSIKSIPETVQEEVETEAPESAVSDKSQQQVHWSYSVKDGNLTAVTPYFGKDAKYATKSPYIRFENAKNKFNGSTTDGAANSTALIKKETDVVVKKETSTALVKKETAIVKKETSIVKKEVPYKSPRSFKAKQGIRKTRQFTAGGSVASKVQELNQRVVEAKLDRKLHRWTKSNPRKYGVIDSNAIRTRAIVQYKTNVVGLDRINYMSAAKFNTIPIDDDDSSVESSAAGSRNSKKSVTFAEPRPLLQLTAAEENANTEDEDDDADDWSKLTADTASVATLKRDNPLATKSIYPSARVSEGTHSTASSGLTNVKKQVFRHSVSTTSSSRPSILSQGDSTTMSAILDKENTNYMAFRAYAKTVKPTEQTIIAKPDLQLSPTQRTTVQAQKWRTLAAAAHLRDSQKKQKQTSGNIRKGLSVKNGNKFPVASYEC